MLSRIQACPGLVEAIMQKFRVPGRKQLLRIVTLALSASDDKVLITFCALHATTRDMHLPELHAQSRAL